MDHALWLLLRMLLLLWLWHLVHLTRCRRTRVLEMRAGAGLIAGMLILLLRRLELGMTQWLRLLRCLLLLLWWSLLLLLVLKLLLHELLSVLLLRMHRQRRLHHSLTLPVAGMR